MIQLEGTIDDPNCCLSFEPDTPTSPVRGTGHGKSAGYKFLCQVGESINPGEWRCQY